MRLLALFACLLLTSLPALPAQNAEKDVDKAVRYTEALESNPMRSDAKRMRQWLVEWLAATPDFEVTVCDILGPVPGDKLKYGPELLLQQMFGNVTFQIKNPTKTDSISVQTAGVVSLLKAYSMILAKDPNAHIPYFDNLLAKQRAGELKDHMAPLIVRHCDDDTA
jgi:hypothetical protein